MAFEVSAYPAVTRRLSKAPAAIREEFMERVESLSKALPEWQPDKAEVWRKAHSELDNHRHVNLREGWRMAFTIIRDAYMPPAVVIVFLGTHREHERKYGFKGS